MFSHLKQLVFLPAEKNINKLVERVGAHSRDDMRKILEAV